MNEIARMKNQSFMNQSSIANETQMEAQSEVNEIRMEEPSAANECKDSRESTISSMNGNARMKEIEILPSKSEAHRMIIAAALSKNPCEIPLRETSDDIEATRACMRAIREARETGEPAELYCKESGSTFRFLIPVVAALGIEAHFHPEGRLPQRPLSPLYEELTAHGICMSELGSVPFVVRGKLSPGEYTIPGNVSSQYITGLLLALPLLPGGSTIRVTGDRQSMGYIDMTLRVLERFGIRIRMEQVTDNHATAKTTHSARNDSVEEISDSTEAQTTKPAMMTPKIPGSPKRRTESTAEDLIFRIPGNQEYIAPTDCTVEGDWSNAAFWLTAGIIGEDPVRVTGLNPDSAQGDRAIVNFIRQFGGRIETEGNTVTAYPSQSHLHGTEIDAAQIPDMVPALALIATQAEGVTEITHAERLRLKESDRLKSVTQVLQALGAEIEELPDGLRISGKTRLCGGKVSGFGDHRIVMMAAIASLAAKGCVVIEGAESVNKSYPTFFTLMEENEMNQNMERR